MPSSSPTREMFPDQPIVLAPMAGGPTTVALVAAVPFGFLAAGYLTAADVERQMDELAGRVYGVNLFAPEPDNADHAAVAAYAERVGGDPADAHWSDDDWDAKLELLRRRPPAVVSFTFGCPSRELVSSLASEVWCTVTSVEEARIAEEAGADALVAQGTEAGGHRGWFGDAAGALTTS